MTNPPQSHRYKDAGREVLVEILDDPELILLGLSKGVAHCGKGWTLAARRR